MADEIRTESIAGKDGPAGRSGRAELAALVLAVSIPAGLIALWASPRAARPVEMPPLVLPSAEVARAIAAENALGAEATDDDHEAARRELYLAQGLAEVRMDDFPEEASGRAARLAHLTSEIGAADPAAIPRARARDVVRMMSALRGEGHLDATGRASELGVFPQMLERYGAVVAGRRVAPEFVIRTMFYARWNAIHGIAMTEGMTALQLRAYYGWLALEGGAAPLGMRIEALDAYAAAGGSRVWEARGVLAFEGGEMAEARGDFERACDLTGSLRLRNHALEAERVALEDGAAL